MPPWGHPGKALVAELQKVGGGAQPVALVTELEPGLHKALGLVSELAGEAAVARAVAGLRIAPLLAGVRGEPAVDVAALCRIAVRVGQLMLEAGGAIRSIDLNPVMVSAGGAVVVDALMEVAADVAPA